MKNLILILAILLCSLNAQAKDVDYEQVYRDLEVPSVKYVHNIDPGEYYDTQNSTWSPYPLIRLNTTLHFKSVTIEPGYYLLTPREHKGDWYMLFKEGGRIKYIIPIYDREIVPLNFYDENLPKVKLTPTQKIHLVLLDTMGKFIPSAKRKPIPQTYLEVTDLENHFVSLVVYWGSYRYYTIFRTIKL